MDTDMMEKVQMPEAPLKLLWGLTMCQLLNYLSFNLNKLFSVGRSQMTPEDPWEMETVRGNLKGHLIYLCFMVRKRKPREGKRLSQETLHIPAFPWLSEPCSLKHSTFAETEQPQNKFSPCCSIFTSKSGQAKTGNTGGIDMLHS